MLNDIHDDLLAIYYKEYVGAISDHCMTKEEERDAKVRSIQLSTSGQLFKISNGFINSKKGLFYKSGGPANPMSRDCDGIIIAELNGQKYIIFLELKSSYTTSEIVVAQQQIMCSYYCLMTELHGLLHFNYTEYKACCMIASHPLSEETKLKFYKWKLTGGIDRCKERALHFAFHPDQRFDLLREDVSDLKDKPFSNNHMFSVLPMFHLPVLNNQDSGLFNIDYYLGQV